MLKDYNLENIILNSYDSINLKKNSYYNVINSNKKSSIYNSYFGSNSYSSNLNLSPINWGSEAQINTQNVFIEPTPQEVQKVLEAVHLVQRLPADQQSQLIEATREIRYFFDGQIRAKFGATQHFNAIRCLNNPQVTQVADNLGIPLSQLAGEEFFALNRFMPNFADIADIQWWSVYKDGSWRLDTWNPQGEHLDTGVNGWGQLVGSVIKLNGQVLTPQEMIGFYRAMKLRNEREFMGSEFLFGMQEAIKILHTEGSAPKPYEGLIERAQELGLVEEDGKTLTYTGMSMITPITARERKRRQTQETDPKIRRIIVPTIFI
jgi:hypothetical protein